MGQKKKKGSRDSSSSLQSYPQPPCTLDVIFPQGNRQRFISATSFPQVLSHLSQKLRLSVNKTALGQAWPFWTHAEASWDERFSSCSLQVEPCSNLKTQKGFFFREDSWGCGITRENVTDPFINCLTKNRSLGGNKSSGPKHREPGALPGEPWLTVAGLSHVSYFLLHCPHSQRMLKASEFQNLLPCTLY